VSSADGYENELSIDKLDSITPQRIKVIVDATPKRPENAVGKIYDSYSCKIVGVLKSDKRIVEGADLKLALSASKNLYTVHVDSVKPVEDDNIMVVMNCDRLDEELAARRQEASGELSAMRSARIREAEEEAAQIIKKAESEAGRKRKEIVDGAKDDITGMIADAADKLLLEGKTEDFYDAFLEEAERGADHA
jgi:vacuolar-type H+-ATPase subunit H